MAKDKKKYTDEQKIQRLKDRIEVAIKNHDEEVKKLRHENEILNIEIEHQNDLITLYDKDVVQTNQELKNLDSDIKLSVDRKYSHKLADLDKIFKEKQTEYFKMSSELPEQRMSKSELRDGRSELSTVNEPDLPRYVRGHNCRTSSSCSELLRDLKNKNTNLNEIYSTINDETIKTQELSFFIEQQSNIIEDLKKTIFDSLKSENIGNNFEKMFSVMQISTDSECHTDTKLLLDDNQDLTNCSLLTNFLKFFETIFQISVTFDSKNHFEKFSHMSEVFKIHNDSCRKAWHELETSFKSIPSNISNEDIQKICEQTNSKNTLNLASLLFEDIYISRQDYLDRCSLIYKMMEKYLNIESKNHWLQNLANMLEILTKGG